MEVDTLITGTGEAWFSVESSNLRWARKRGAGTDTLVLQYCERWTNVKTGEVRIDWKDVPIVNAEDA